ncbi:MAG TPA: TolC family protein [Sedimentisphaerales bacterium]|nr:TolC family protein [Sedimentisphaerales bacterium]HNU30931.1 TolC family protein [Sedimentisphaerales bacterium]
MTGECRERALAMRQAVHTVFLSSLLAVGIGRVAFAADSDRAEPLRIDIQRAILLAMENNRSLIVQKMTPDIIRTGETEERAIFDPTFSGQASQKRTVADRLSRAGSGVESSIADTATGSISLEKLFPSGTTVGLAASTSYTDSSLYSDTFVANRLAASVTQSLLQGRDVRVNLASVHQAAIDAQISEYELRGFTEALVQAVEEGFWDYALAKRQIEIYTNSLSLAEQQMNETQERIRFGALGETELAAAKAEVALRRENLINARASVATRRLHLLRLLNPSETINWDTDIVLDYLTALPDIPLDPVEAHVQVALKMRPDLNQARLLIRRGELDVVRTRNGLLPRLDAFVTYGKTGYARTFADATDDIDERSYDVEAGLILEFPAGNRAAKARRSRAVITKQQSIKALENLTQLAQVDIRSAYVEVGRTREQIAATAATRTFQEEKLRVETEKFRVGKSTSLLVAQAQRDLMVSQIAEVQVVVNYLKALVSLYQLEGSLLERRGIAAPGAEPVELDEGK